MNLFAIIFIGLDRVGRELKEKCRVGCGFKKLNPRSTLLFTTLIAYLDFVETNRGYSYYLIIVAFIFAYLASLLAVF